MKVAFTHYHLKPGGVTTVIRHQINAVKTDCDILVLTGEPPPADFPADCAVIPGLAYDEKAPEHASPEEIVEDILDAMNKKWGTSCDVLHVHNPLLAKNKRFLEILNILNEKGISLFLQIHDFAEDGRPNAYYTQEYPKNCHYGVINSRDYNILLKSGLDATGLHKIANMVPPLDIDRDAAAHENMVLYPVRPIRRKNIGEAILLSLFFKNRETLAITLTPNSPMDIESYKGWKTYVLQNSLNVKFEASKSREFTDLVRVSKYIITTSITEGFGFSFLEPWTGYKMLWGRKLPDICVDFQQNNINLDELYTTIDLPVEWIDRNMLFEKWRYAMVTAYRQFGISPETNTAENVFDLYIKNNCIDFGLLNEEFQKQVITKVRSSKKTAEELIRINPFLRDLDISENKDLIRQNRDAVLNIYNQAAYKKNLLDIYWKVKKNTIQHRIDKRILFTAFVNPSRFSLLKWSDYES